MGAHLGMAWVVVYVQVRTVHAGQRADGSGDDAGGLQARDKGKTIVSIAMAIRACCCPDQSLVIWVCAKTKYCQIQNSVEKPSRQ